MSWAAFPPRTLLVAPLSYAAASGFADSLELLPPSNPPAHSLLQSLKSKSSNKYLYCSMPTDNIATPAAWGLAALKPTPSSITTGASNLKHLFWFRLKPEKFSPWMVQSLGQERARGSGSHSAE